MPERALMEQLDQVIDLLLAGAAPAAGDPELAALTNLCQQLLSSNEFLYAD